MIIIKCVNSTLVTPCVMPGCCTDVMNMHTSFHICWYLWLCCVAKVPQDEYCATVQVILMDHVDWLDAAAASHLAARLAEQVNFPHFLLPYQYWLSCGSKWERWQSACVVFVSKNAQQTCLEYSKQQACHAWPTPCIVADSSRCCREQVACIAGASWWTCYLEVCSNCAPLCQAY